MTHIDQRRLITLRLQRGLAVRQLARDCGIEIAVLNRLETAADPNLTTLSVAAITRLADHLGVPVGTLFADDTTPTPDTTTGEATDAATDARVLGALLTSLGVRTPVVALIDALGWTNHRIHAAAASLDPTIRPAGMTLYKKGGFMAIQPVDDTHTDAELAVRRHPRARSKQRLVSPARSRLLYAAAQAPISPPKLSGNDRLQIATLLKAGVLIENEQRCFVPSPDVLTSLHPQDA